MDQRQQEIAAFAQAWNTNPAPPLEDYVPQDLPNVEAHVLELLAIDLEKRGEVDQVWGLADYVAHYPALESVLRNVWELAQSKAMEAARTQAFAVSPGTTEGGDDSLLVAPGQLGRYELRRRVGGGGFGVVYEAYDPQLERVVAIKIPRGRCLQDPEAIQLYIAEARALASFDHPHIVPIFDVGQTAEVPCYLVSKFIDGSPLGKLGEALRDDREQLIRIVAQVAEALHQAHKQGIFHRDIKPDNILVDQTGKAYLADFGIALTEEQVGSGPRITGTKAYMSPEQISGDSHLVDGRSDIYSLGVVLYELLCGRRPFTASSHHDLTRQIVEISPRPLRSIRDDIPSWLESACQRAMAKHREDRYQTAGDFAKDLLAGLHTSQPAAMIAPTSPSRSARRVALAAAAMVVIVVAAVLFRSFGSGANQVDSPEVDKPSDVTGGDPPSAPTTETLQVQRFDIRVFGPGRNGDPIEQAMPIRQGDAITFSVELNRAAYVYLYWIDTKGEVMELFPDDPELGLRTTEKIKDFQSPERFQQGWPVIGEGGMETAILLVNEEPVPDKGQLLARLRLPASEEFNTVQETVVYELAENQAAATVAMSQHRGVGSKSVAIDQPVLRLLDGLKGDFTTIKAIRIAHQELVQ